MVVYEEHAPDPLPDAIGLLLRRDGTVLVLPGEAPDEAEVVVGPAGQYVRLLPGDAFAGVPFEAWAEQLGRAGTIAEIADLMLAREPARTSGIRPPRDA